MELKTIGVIGAGVMGRGVSQALAQTNHRVILVDLSTVVLEQAQAEIKQNLRFQTLFTQGDTSQKPEEILKRIHFTTQYVDLAQVDFVIENVTEKWQVKEVVYPQLDQICPPACVFAADTSAIPITAIAALTERPEKVLGMHFMNPVSLKPVVEVIRGQQTSEQTLETARRLLAQMGKSAIVVQDAPGFVSNRVLMLTVNEAIFLVEEGTASARDVDMIFKQCFGHKMGPLETADLIGLDTILLTLEVLVQHYPGDKFQPCPLLVEMVTRGQLGRKSGQGFYPHSI
ncbi:MAG: 3-hydroxyacyl-CoA dehydrogenase family protein [Anaerolineales bacterium]|nr:3-hydroxyacyl-CoA dehydrogenase family protein [Anaerolineales bacterium]